MDSLPETTGDHRPDQHQAWRRKFDQYAVSYNSERAKHAVAPLPAGWIAGDFSSDNEITWLNPAKNDFEAKSKSFHVYKFLSLRNDSVEMESDRYYSGKKWSDPGFEGGKEESESLTINYYYQAAAYPVCPGDLYKKDWAVNIFPWFCELRTSPRTRYISIEEANAILTSWGIDRQQ